MPEIMPLPKLMVAPNGARRTKSDHPNIPISADELVDTAICCQAAGSDGIHVHLRDLAGKHLLDALQYRKLLKRLEDAVPGMYLQVTSEAAGLYNAPTQQAMVRALKPRHVSVAMREMVRSATEWPVATDFYSWTGQNDVQVQHIIYSANELKTFIAAASEGKIPGTHFQLQFVLGTYDGSEVSKPENLADFIDLLDSASSQMTFDWMLCAFGKEETVCLTHAVRSGGKIRVGFENSLWNADGSLAKDNAERVREIVAATSAL